MYLHSGGRLSEQCYNAAEMEPADTYQYDPQNPSFSAAPPRDGKMLEIGDYAPVSQRDDVLTYETEPLTQDMPKPRVMPSSSLARVRNSCQSSKVTGVFIPNLSSTS